MPAAAWGFCDACAAFSFVGLQLVSMEGKASALCLTSIKRHEHQSRKHAANYLLLSFDFAMLSFDGCGASAYAPPLLKLLACIFSAFAMCNCRNDYEHIHTGV